jgi:hypothetical protein
MGVMIVHHAVRDYAAWRPAYDAHEAARRAAGLTNGRVFRSTEDPNDILILFDTSDRRRAEEFGGSEDLKSAMQNSGVIGQPKILFAD